MQDINNNELATIRIALLDKIDKINEVYSFKLNSGEELVAKVILSF